MQATLKDIEADTIVAELSTDKNKLSVWKVEDNEDLNDAFIALGSNCDNICTITAIKMADEDLKSITFEDEEGNTPTHGINQKHKNMIQLNYCSLGRVILTIIRSLRQNNYYVKRTKGQMKKLLIQAYNDDKLDMENMKPSLVNELMKALKHV